MSPSATSSLELVRKAQGGDNSAREELLRTCDPMPPEYFARLVKAKDLAIDREDLIQGVYCHILLNLPKYDPERNGPICAWMQLTATRFVKGILDTPERPAVAHDFERWLADSLSGSRDVRLRDQAEVIRQKIALLPERSRSILTAVFIDGKTQRDWAVANGVSDATAFALKAAGLELLREMLGSGSNFTF